MQKKLDNAISTFTHEIKNPLHSAVLNLEVVHTRLARSSLKDAKDMLKHTQIIDKELRKLQLIVDNFLQDIGKSKKPMQ